jgi:hypothetical protein
MKVSREKLYLFLRHVVFQLAPQPLRDHGEQPQLHQLLIVAVLFVDYPLLLNA